MPRYSPEFKARAVELYEQGYTYVQALEKTQGEFGGGLPSVQAVTDWVQASRARALGEAVEPVFAAKNPPEVVGTAVALVLVGGVSSTDVARQLGISRHRAASWVRDFGPPRIEAAVMSFDEVRLQVMDNVRKHRRDKKPPKTPPIRFGQVADNLDRSQLPDDPDALKEMLVRERQARIMDQAVIKVLSRRPAPGKE